MRDLRRLADTRFDVLVVGAGVYGATIAWDAASRGLHVGIIDRGDIGGGTSFNNLKTLHGGLRSLQALNLEQMRRFIRERRALARIAPHLVRPLPFIIPTTRHPKRHALLMRLALTLNDLIAHDRNQGILDADIHLPAGTLVSRKETLRLNPAIDDTGVTGGAIWFDYQMLNADRMTLSFVLSAVAAGATVANYVRADRLIVEDGRVAGVSVTDGATGDTFAVRARAVVNAAGAWAPELVRELPGGGAVPAPRLSRAMNIVVSPTATSHACGGFVDGRFLCLVPWRDVSILGTSHDVFDQPADALASPREAVEQLLAEGRRAFPRAKLSWDDVRLVHRGLLPMVSGEGARVQLLRETAIVDHAQHGTAGLVSVHGVRYTTARHSAQQAVDAVFQQLGHASPPASRTDRTPLAGGGMSSVVGLKQELLRRDNPGVPAAMVERLVTSYGTDYNRVLQIMRDEPALASPIGQRCGVSGAEIVHAARHEMAMTLSDALIRRTEAGSAGHPGADAVARAAQLLATVHGWDASRVQHEIDDVEAFYRLE
ncbi:MAG: glycerol-3-phosphate dehydrogenase/oxidase [Acidobacteria bacterium]|nr:glycerol-3-phosphate dehydrogenase/oxidase [Acidobacteriota bacterium]